MQNAKMDIGLFGMFHHLYFQQERVQTNFFAISKAMFITFPLLSSKLSMKFLIHYHILNFFSTLLALFDNQS